MCLGPYRMLEPDFSEAPSSLTPAGFPIWKIHLPHPLELTTSTHVHWEGFLRQPHGRAWYLPPNLRAQEDSHGMFFCTVGLMSFT